MLSAADFVALQVQALPQPQALLQSQRSPQLQRSVAPISHPHDSSLHRHSLWIWFGIALSWFVARSSALVRPANADPDPPLHPAESAEAGPAPRAMRTRKEYVASR